MSFRLFFVAFSIEDVEKKIETEVAGILVFGGRNLQTVPESSLAQSI